MKKNTMMLLLSGMLFCCSLVKAQPVLLKFNPPNGSKYDMNMIAQSVWKQKIASQDMEIKTDYTMNMLYDIKDAGGNKEIKMTYDRLKLKTEAMGQTINMDSEDPDTSQSAGKIFRSLKGSVITVTMAPDGSVVKVEGAEEVLKKTADGNAQAEETLKNIVSEDALKSMMEQSFKLYPNKPVKPGDTWNTTTQVTSPYAFSSHNTYTLNKIENGKSYLDVVSKISTDGKQKMEANGMQMEITLDGDNKGTMVVDNKTGMPQSSDGTLTLKGNLDVMGQQVPLEIVTTSKMEGRER